jgi:acetolactate synthase small subunit
MIVELSGTEAFILSCIRALERFGVVEVARSGTVALGSGTDIPSGTLP